MIEFSHILCPTDLSTKPDKALRYALALARAYESKLTLCYRPNDEELASAAIVLGRGAAGSFPPETAKVVFERALLTFLSPETPPNLDWQGLLIQGEDVGAAITRTAAECSADLIVMRSRRRPHRAALLGSTAESVCRTAPCPVLVMHADERDWVQPLSRSISLQRVLVPYDFSDYSELALEYALAFAQEYQAELHMLHILPPHVMNEPEMRHQREAEYDNVTRNLQSVLPDEASLWCGIKYVISEGQPYREVLNYAEKNSIDLISIGAHGAGYGMHALFGSNVDRVLRQAPCPVLVARPLSSVSSQS